MSAISVLLGCPMADGRLDIGTARGLLARPARKRQCAVVPTSNSLLTTNHNGLLCEALNARSQGVAWLAILHSDVTPADCWVDTLIDTAEEWQADLVSAVVPIKDSRGLTSTAIAHPEDPWRRYCRLTQAQVNHPGMPDTFDIHALCVALDGLPEPLRIADPPRTALLVNTGCMVLRLSTWYAERLCFETRDRIIQGADGRWKPQCQPEDWVLSAKVAAFGGRVVATRRVPVSHEGRQSYRSGAVWGEERDGLCLGERAEG